ncbi:MAG: HlyD family efflux transporter periplasmic adaptor subunit [Candidatus Pacebacteria bacterium]|jgi:multidrug efflux pump subunit AcrA (membrane-fusion protein)|nr:HlyD family efflux transporter periplasmic adaptor subunit [Candidatus Paceibacterota bacterium]MBT3511824.1 HlyD family efflux transporter periplasmic adaptor subunit [Candidatus Paceibacterota bacterium]MBT4004616.1 HlyD family efflux transporter periplasmic adaptor subunit [Candidatus Paceibacterota bacterium]MBT4358344.1 HlyD family efflux transporter periplasmic adaptor subunit [Candidatus Paceibacterota bacterium]MBT4681392.1 HlyD family efflux transporter periplasmic adaptor subunit [
MKKKLNKITNSSLEFFKKNWKKISIGFAIALTIGGLRYKKIQADKPQLTFESPRYQNLTKVLEVSGVVDAKEKANLRFAAGGKVVYLGAKEGDWVKKWQTIATIDKRTLQKQLQQNLNLYMKERWDWESTQDVTDYSTETLDTRKVIDKEQWDLNNEVLDVEINNIAITNTVLSAPFAGILVGSPTSVTGVNLLATDAFELVNPETLVFKALVDEADISLVEPGQSAKISLDSYPDEDMQTQVNYVAYKSIASSTGTIFIVELPVSVLGENDSTIATGQSLINKYRLGMNGDVSIELETKDNILTIPFESTRERDGQVFVDIKSDDAEEGYIEREIQIDLETEDYVEVLSGLDETDQVLIPEN